MVPMEEGLGEHCSRGRVGEIRLAMLQWRWVRFLGCGGGGGDWLVPKYVDEMCCFRSRWRRIAWSSGGMGHWLVTK